MHQTFFGIGLHHAHIKPFEGLRTCGPTLDISLTRRGASGYNWRLSWIWAIMKGDRHHFYVLLRRVASCEVCLGDLVALGQTQKVNCPQKHAGKKHRGDLDPRSCLLASSMLYG